jgi:hypothetical protein
MIFPILYIDLILCRKKIIHIPAAPKSLALPPSAIPPKAGCLETGAAGFNFSGSGNHQYF